MEKTLYWKLGFLCGDTLEKKKVLKVSLRPSGRVNHAVPPEFRAFALHLTESSNSFFCNGKIPSASTRSLWKLLLRRDDHTGLPAALSPPAALFEEDAVRLSPSTLCDYYFIRLPAKKQAS